jgi:hypothetical protein
MISDGDTVELNTAVFSAPCFDAGVIPQMSSVYFVTNVVRRRAERKKAQYLSFAATQFRSK